MTFDDELTLLESGYSPVFSQDAGLIVGWFTPDYSRLIYTTDKQTICNKEALALLDSVIAETVKKITKQAVKKKGNK